MANTDFQLGIVNEVTYGTPVTVTKFYEFESESIEEQEGRTQLDPLRTGSAFQRNDRFTPYFGGAAGTVQMTVLTKGFGYWLKHMIGQVATSGPTDVTAYTHTGTEASLTGNFFTLQLNRPFTPSGTNQAFTYSGGKITGWTLSNSVDKHLLLDLNCDFMKSDSAVALATAAYPATSEPLSWAGGLITIAGTPVDVTDFSLQVDNGLDVDRRQIRANTDKKEPIGGRRSAQFSVSLDFADLTQRNRSHAALRATALATLSAKWTGPVLAGAATVFPSLTASMTAARFDAWKAPIANDDGSVSQTLTGEILYDGSASPITLAYVTSDTTP